MSANPSRPAMAMQVIHTGTEPATIADIFQSRLERLEQRVNQVEHRLDVDEEQIGKVSQELAETKQEVQNQDDKMETLRRLVEERSRLPAHYWLAYAVLCLLFVIVLYKFTLSLSVIPINSNLP